VGQQQLLLIVLGVIIVGIAVVLGINLFRSHAIESKKGLITNECINLAAMAQKHYRLPGSLGGGGSSFDNAVTGIKWDIPNELKHTASGDYEITERNASHVVIKATGNEVVNGVDQVQVQITVYSDTYQVLDLSPN
jgi:hypothetical protein